jgi:hypothetical protein
MFATCHHSVARLKCGTIIPLTGMCAGRPGPPRVPRGCSTVNPPPLVTWTQTLNTNNTPHGPTTSSKDRNSSWRFGRSQQHHADGIFPPWRLPGSLTVRRSFRTLVSHGLLEALSDTMPPWPQPEGSLLRRLRRSVAVLCMDVLLAIDAARGASISPSLLRQFTCYTCSRCHLHNQVNHCQWRHDMWRFQSSAHHGQLHRWSGVAPSLLLASKLPRLHLMACRICH